MRRRLLLLLLLAACRTPLSDSENDAGPTDGGRANSDAGATDAGANHRDAGQSDAGLPPMDGGVCPAPVSVSADGGPPTCGPSGLVGPLPTCSPALPCTIRALDGGIVMESLTSDLNPELRPDGGHQCPQPDPGGDAGDSVFTWSAPGLAPGEQRWACLYTPPAAEAQPKPLVLFFPGSQADADSVYGPTTLHDKASTFDLSDGGDGPGFILATLQSRNLHDFAGTDGDGQHEDAFFRDLASPSCNPDIAAADALIDALVARSIVDTARIYVMGWSNGAHFGQLYAIARHGTPTPGQNRVAATMVYAGADPFGGVPKWGTDTTCQATTYPTSNVPLYEVHRSCDALVPCDAAQDVFFNGDASVENWLTVTLPEVVADTTVVDQIIDGTNAPVNACQTVPPCGVIAGTLNHLNWPKASAGGGMDWEPPMLDFGAQHPL